MATQVLLNIGSKKKWGALKIVLEAMDINFTAQEMIEKLTEREIELLHMAENDKANGMMNVYSSHREILGG